MIKIINIKWETDGESVELPTEVNIDNVGIIDLHCCDDFLNCENNSESVNNYLSDKYGWLVDNYDITVS